MLHEIDESIARLLLDDLERAEGLPKGVQVTVGEPPEEPKGEPRLNLFLHDVVENLAQRDQSFEVRPGPDLWTVGKGRRPTRIDASYLLTAHAEDAATEHRLLGAALRTMLRHGYVPPRLLGESLAPFGDEALSLMVAQRDGWAHRDVAAVWTAARRALRPAVGIVATAMIDPYETKTVRLVREAVFGLAQGVPAEGARRQMDLRSLRVGAAGRVVDDDDDRALAGAELFVDGAAAGRADARGVFLARDLAAGERTIRIEAGGYTPWEGTVEAAAPMRGGALEPLEVRLRREKAGAVSTGLRVEGTLRHADGRPAAYVPVTMGGRTAVTDAEGRYVFEVEEESGRMVLLPPESGIVDSGEKAPGHNGEKAESASLKVLRVKGNAKTS